MSKHDVVLKLATGEFGGFAAKLADAWFVADGTNRKLIEETFAHLFRRINPDF